jgi:hypothetical protein
MDAIPVIYSDEMSSANDPPPSPSADKPRKVVAAWEQTLLPIDVRPVVPATPEDLSLAHDPAFVRRILACEEDSGFGNNRPDVALPGRSGRVRTVVHSDASCMTHFGVASARIVDECGHFGGLVRAAEPGRFNDHEIAYAVKNGQLVHVDEVDRGLACGCVCPACAGPLLARKGAERRHHFAHATGVDCQGAVETILHRLAKECLSELSAIDLPQYILELQHAPRAGASIKSSYQVLFPSCVDIRAVQIEKRTAGIIPDVTLTTTSGQLLVEVVVTNVVSRDKLRVLRRNSMATLEIRLDRRDAWHSRAVFRERLIHDLSFKRWLFHPDQRAFERAFYSTQRRNASEERRRRRQPVSHRYVDQVRKLYELQGQRNPTKSEWMEFNTFGELYFARYGRYPSMAECDAFARSRKGKK